MWWTNRRDTTAVGSWWTCGSTSTTTRLRSWPGSLELNDLYFGSPEDVQPLQGPLADEVRERLGKLGYRGELDAALGEWAGVENYEMRLTPDGIDARVLAQLRAATGG
jgi:hypothetical protein